MQREQASAIVLGAGLAGAGVALELAARGVDVVLVERDGQVLNRASLRNEGKIHLGLIYACDPSMHTARLQLQGALRFAPILRRWLGDGLDRIACSAPFYYAVARDSVLGPDELERHYERLRVLCEEEQADAAASSYLGARVSFLHRRLPRAEWSPHLNAAHFQALFETEERAIDPSDLAREIAVALASSPRIDLRAGCTVDRIAREADGFVVEGRGAEGRWRISAKQVVNAMWEHRLWFDAQLGLDPVPGWLYRLKFRIIARLPEHLRSAPTVTMVLGRYGDVVVRPDGTAFLSWYPVGLQGWSHALRPPDDWDGPCRGVVEPARRERLVRAMLAALDDWYPGLAGCEPLLVDAGAIVAYGATDVDDRASGLHDRSRIGVFSRDGYHSVESGKLTTAPLFAVAAADRVCGSIA